MSTAAAGTALREGHVEVRGVMYHVRQVYAGRSVDHYRVSAGGKGGEGGSVRVGPHGVFACLLCHSVSCAHAMAGQAFARTVEVEVCA